MSRQRAAGLVWLGTRCGQGKGKVKAGGTPGPGKAGRAEHPRYPGGSTAGGCSWQSPGSGCSVGSPGWPGSSMGSAETKAGGEQKAEGNKGDSCGVAGLAADGVVVGARLFVSKNICISMLILTA